ncbi:Hypp1634 [Branchiostoma lanceolatum]|uniref:Hypp1634 protein n=1 Tax=Branchiostoma lanceolatum TaxID=7740 RepID=A0A8J9ZJB5_BRALA|nr:Hypp1634 [Branchiostoma lanceolatum]
MKRRRTLVYGCRCLWKCSGGEENFLNKYDSKGSPKLSHRSKRPCVEGRWRNVAREGGTEGVRERARGEIPPGKSRLPCSSRHGPESEATHPFGWSPEQWGKAWVICGVP